MAGRDRDTEAALFIDFENIHTSVRRQLNDNVDWQLLLKSVEPFGRLAIRRAYSDWARNADYLPALARMAIEPINAVSLHKNVSDIVLAVDAMETLADRPDIETYIIVSGDSDLTILTQRLRRHQKEVVGVGVHGATSSVMVEACDEFIFYDDLIRKRAEIMNGNRDGRHHPSLPPIQHSEAAYLNAIRRQRLYMTPHPYRANVIIQVYDIMEKDPPPSLTALKQRVETLYQTDPRVDSRLVSEVMYQLFYSYAFDIDRRPDLKLWDCPFRLKPHIKSGQDLLRNTDIDIIKRVIRGLGTTELNPAIVSRVLYGRDDHPALLRRVEGFLQQLCEAPEPHA